MLHFVQDQLDFIYFIHGLAFFALAAVCLTMPRPERRALPWHILAASAIANGCAIWLGFADLVFEHHRWVETLHILAMLTAYVLLMEFARDTWVRLQAHGPNRWLLLAVLAAVVPAGIVGIEGLHFAARLVLACGGGCWAMLALLLAAARLPNPTACRLLRIVAILLGAITVANLIPPPAQLIIPPGGGFLPPLAFLLQPLYGIAVFSLVIMLGLYACTVHNIHAEAFQPRRNARFLLWMAMIYLVIITVGGVRAYGITAFFRAEIIHQYTDGIAEHAAMLDTETIGRLQGTPADAVQAGYPALLRQLKVFRTLDRHPRSIYLLAKRQGRWGCLLGLEPKHPSPILPETLTPPMDRTIRRFLANGVTAVEGPVYTREGEWYYCVAPIRGATGEITAALGVLLPGAPIRIALLSRRAPILVNTLMLSLLALAFLLVLQSVRESGARTALSENRFRSLYENAGDIIFLLNPEWQFTSFNSAGEKITGFSPHRGMQLKVTDLIAPEYLEQAYRYITEVIAANGDVPPIEVEVIAYDGSRRMMEVNARLITLDGQPTEIQGIARDITERKREEAAARYRRRLRAVITGISTRFINCPLEETGQEIMRALQEAGSAVQACRSYLVLLAEDDETVPVVYEWHDTEAPPLLPQVQRLLPETQAALRALLQSGQTIAQSAQSADGAGHRAADPLFTLFDSTALLAIPLIRNQVLFGLLCVDAAPGKEWSDTDDALLRMLGDIIINAVMHFRDMQALSNSEERYRELVETQHDPVIRLDTGWRYTFVNEAYCRLRGKKAEELLGALCQPLDLTNDRTRLDTLLQSLFSPPYHISIEQRLLTGGGEERWIAWEGYAIRNARGEVVEVQGVGHDVTDRKLAEERLNFLAYHDPLTGLPNRLLFLDRLSQAVMRAKRRHEYVAVVLLDLDRFKEINDSLGHDCGDVLLQEVSARLCGIIREEDSLCRIGGDEFVLVLPDLDRGEFAENAVRRITECFTFPFDVNGHELHVTASVGISLYPDDGQRTDALFKHADLAMYAAKARGKNTYCFFSAEMSAEVTNKIALGQELRKALEQEQLTVHYQPQFSLRRGQLVGVEALVRWKHPIRGMIPPLEFIPIAEELGLIETLDEFVLRTACRQVLHWRAQGYPRLRAAVNLSARHFERLDLVESIMAILNEVHFPPVDLELEITESAAMQNWERTRTVLNELCAHGVRIAIDDFGTGYCSLGYLHQFPVHTLKIDRSFIHHIAQNRRYTAIVSAIIAMAGTLNLSVVAEAVETAEQLDVLHALRCELAQGYYLGKPVPAEIFPGIYLSTRVNPLVTALDAVRE